MITSSSVKATVEASKLLRGTKTGNNMSKCERVQKTRIR